MAVTEILAGSIDTFCDSPIGCRACFFITTLAWFLHTFLSYGTDNWAELSEGPTESNQGLWNHCSKSLSDADITCRESVSNFLEYRNQDVPAGSILIGSSIYGGQYRYITWLKGYYLSWSFAFSILAGLVHLVSGSIYMFTLPNSVSNQPTSNQSLPLGVNFNNHNDNRPEPAAPPLVSGML